jgi:hypothetical protein
VKLEIYKPIVTPTDDDTLWLQLSSNRQIDDLIKNTTAANFAPTETILNLFDSLRLIGIYSALTDAFIGNSFPSPALMREVTCRLSPVPLVIGTWLPLGPCVDNRCLNSCGVRFPRLE